MADKTSRSPLFSWQHYVVIAIGALVLVLLFFADKTNLKGDDEEISPQESVEVASASPMMKNSGPVVKLPDGLDPLPDDPAIDSIILELEGADLKEADAKTEESFRSLVELLTEKERIDAAAWYAGILSEMRPSTKNYVVAGALLRTAASIPPVSDDTVLFRQYSDKAIQLLTLAVELAPNDEDAMIEFGLAMVESRSPMNSMKGIQQLVKVLEINPNNGEASFHLGVFSQQTGQFEKAAGRFEKVLSVDPDNQLAAYYLATSYLEIGKTAEAKALLIDLQKQNINPGIANAARDLLNTIN